MRKRAYEMLTSGEVTQALVWEKGDFLHYPGPVLIKSAEGLAGMVYDRFCAANLSKYLIELSGQPGKTLVFLRPCDAYAFARLLEENQIKREKTYVVGVGCEGIVLVDDGVERGLFESCLVCTKTDHPVYDELIGADTTSRIIADETKRFEKVTELEEKNATERYIFWQSYLSRCIRCNACRNVCPTCYCKKCIFDNSDNPLEKQHFHIIRAYHQNERCTDCGQCSRVCPMKIPLNLLNRKLIKDRFTKDGITELNEKNKAGGT
jgi:ferredoxin